MPNVFQIIGTAWSFYKKHPVLNSIVFWLLFVPPSIIDAFSGVVGTAMAQSPLGELDPFTGMNLAFTLLTVIVLVVFFLWGQACILIVGQRLIKSPAGRNQTSFSSVRKKARKYIFSLFYTEIIRTCMTLLWTLLFIIPGIIYSIRTAFYDIIIVSENTQGRDALHKSIDVIKGRTFTVLLYFMGLGIIIMLPATLFDTFIQSGLPLIDARFVPLGSIISNGFGSFAYMLFLLSSIVLYKELKAQNPQSDM